MRTDGAIANRCASLFFDNFLTSVLDICPPRSLNRLRQREGRMIAEGDLGSTLATAAKPLNYDLAPIRPRTVTHRVFVKLFDGFEDTFDIFLFFLFLVIVFSRQSDILVGHP